MKRIYFFLFINLFAFQLFASDLVLIRTNSFTVCNCNFGWKSQSKRYHTRRKCLAG